ncbi:MAG: hypothetical protein V2J08_10320 [Desulfotignum sp.]|jgi:hypothetical protein|nr:hypothetical protein [Desulfotignum sp.]
MNHISVGFSIHRPEIVPVTARIMEQHDVIFLEEPPDAGFENMLNSSLGVEDYLMSLDLEYPEFSRSMCYLERDLYASGKKLIQVEPFVEALLSVHEFFAQGNKPGDLKRNTLPYFVYLVERNASGALLAYYQTAMIGSFEQTIASVKKFARSDAARFRLRDSLRSQEIAHQAGSHQSIFVEAGMIHFYLWQQLRRKLKGSFRVQPVFLDRAALQQPNRHYHTYSPGDQLTLAYVFHPGLSCDKWESLMAARSIIYSKIIQKEENPGDSTPFFHLTDEIDCIRTARILSFRDCKILYTVIRHAGTEKARLAVADYIKTHYHKHVLL